MNVMNMAEPHPAEQQPGAYVWKSPETIAPEIQNSDAAKANQTNESQLITVPPFH